MTRPDSPDPSPTPLVLPRPNLGPEPWADPPAGWHPAEWSVGLTLVAALAGLALWRTRVRATARRRTTGGADPGPGLLADPTPTGRLIASAGPVRAALVAEFGAAWAARTTEEIALDPSLAARVGEDAARALAAYLDRVDRAKFAGEEIANVDVWIGESRSFLDRLGAGPGPARRPAEP